MEFLGRLKQILNIEVKDNKAAENLKEIKLVDFSNSGTKNIYKNKIEIGTLVVPINTANTDVAGQIQQAIRKAVSDESTPVLEASFKKELDDYSVYDKAASSDVVLNELLAVVDPVDKNLLRAAFYLRSIHQEGGSVSVLKKDIVDRYGERGKNVSNLCSAGYFETVIYPMLQELRSQEGFTEELFRERFEVIITSYPFAVFVSVQSDVDAVVQEIVKKIETNKRYGIKHLKLHAIGAKNVKTSQEALESKDVMALLEKEPVVTLIKNVFEAEIYF